MRKTWELNPDQFDLSNPSWTTYLSDLALKAMKGLGCPAGIVAKPSLYKLLLYEEGAMFKAHKECVRPPFEHAPVTAKHLVKHGKGAWNVRNLGDLSAIRAHRW